MTTREAYTLKVEAELDLAQAKLINWKAKVKNASADLSIEYNKYALDLEQKVAALRVKLTEVKDAGEDAWESLKQGIDSALTGVKTTISSIADKIL